MPPLVGITTDLIDVHGTTRSAAAAAYARCVAEAGGIPVLLPPIAAKVVDHARACDAFVFTGGDDPRTEPFGEPTHPLATPVHPDRQEYETALLRVLAGRFPDKPVLGICLGMQMMALVAGGRLDQHMPETRGEQDAARHWGADHPVNPVAGPGGGQAATWARGEAVHSHHRQCVTDPGSLVVFARAPDGVIEAVGDPRRRHYVGVQWHPERTSSPALGLHLFEALVLAARPEARGATSSSIRSATMS